ncbi:hypothetical protein [Anaplasma phagocytophilum]|uniref:hypothetical protein n=1 Tax=Anaplasma phagocytophilum TaxID=948 RepID=UPI0032C454CB
MEISHPNIDNKVCSGSHAKGSEQAGNTSVDGYIVKPTANTATGQCSGLKSAPTAANIGLTKFVSNAKVGEDKNWPTGQIWDGSKAVEGKSKGNAEAIATDLVKLNRDEKTIVAGLLAKTIEGGEVVEIRAVSSTFIRIRDELLHFCPC